MRYCGTFGSAGYAYEIDEEMFERICKLHEQGAKRGDSDQEIAAACFALIESDRLRNGATVQ